MSRFAAGILFVIAMCAALPVGAARRVALLIDQQPGAPDQTAALSKTLIDDFGFDVIRAGVGPGRDLASDVADFRARIVKSEMAVLLFAGAAEHDRTGTFLLQPARRSADARGVNLDELLVYMERNSERSLVLLEAAGTAAPSSGRQAGFGWMPVVPDKLLISVSSGPSTLRMKGAKTLWAVLAERVKGGPLAPMSLVAAVRDQTYIDTYGLNVMRNYGSLPPAFQLEGVPKPSAALTPAPVPGPAPIPDSPAPSPLAKGEPADVPPTPVPALTPPGRAKGTEREVAPSRPKKSAEPPTVAKKVLQPTPPPAPRPKVASPAPAPRPSAPAVAPASQPARAAPRGVAVPSF